MFLKLFHYLRRIYGAVRNFLLAPKNWAQPLHSSIVVLDGTNHSVLVPLFSGESYKIIYLQGEEICLAPRVLIATLWYTLKMRHLKAGYAMAMLDQVDPSIVVTYIDNNHIFQMAARQYRKARFLAVQNGNRFLERDNPPESPAIYHREFACLGQYEVDWYIRYGASVGKYHPVGSLKDSYYRSSRVKLGNATKQFDLCLVSQVRPAMQYKHSERLKSFALLAQHIRRFCESYNKTLCVALRKHPETDSRLYEWELAWFGEHLGSTAKLVPNDPAAYTTYRLIDASRISLGMHSTALREGFGRHNRILSCNFTGNHVYDFPVDGPWSLKDSGYAAFEQRLLWLLDMSDEEYKNLCGDAPKYLIGYDEEMPTHIFLQNLIADAVRGVPVPSANSVVTRTFN